MTDTISAERRSANMRAIRSKDTQIELDLRRALWADGLRGYRVHRRGLPGKPDLAFGRAKLVVFVDGCFWHGCPECYREPKSNSPYWREKVQSNRRRDDVHERALVAQGWVVLRFWEHSVERDLDSCVRAVRLMLETQLAQQ